MMQGASRSSIALVAWPDDLCHVCSLSLGMGLLVTPVHPLSLQGEYVCLSVCPCPGAFGFQPSYNTSGCSFHSHRGTAVTLWVSGQRLCCIIYEN